MKKRLLAIIDILIHGPKKQQVALNIDGKSFTGSIKAMADQIDDVRQSKGATERIFR